MTTVAKFEMINNMTKATKNSLKGQLQVLDPDTKKQIIIYFKLLGDDEKKETHVARMVFSNGMYVDGIYNPLRNSFQEHYHPKQESMLSSLNRFQFIFFWKNWKREELVAISVENCSTETKNILFNDEESI